MNNILDPGMQYIKLCRTYILITSSILLSACATMPGQYNKPIQSHYPKHRYNQEYDSAPRHMVDVSLIRNAIPKIEPTILKYNPPSYYVNGQRYHVLKNNTGYHATGIASWYGTKFQNYLTSSGEKYDMFKMTAASKTLRIPCYARVTNLENGHRVIVKVNDRGPFKQDRILDLSYVAAKKLNILQKGTGLVEVSVLTPQVAKTASTKTIQLPKNTKPRIYLQLGAYSESAHATIVEHDAQKAVNTVPYHVYRQRRGKELLYLVRIGPIPTVAAADIITSKLKAAHLPTPMTVIEETMR